MYILPRVTSSLRKYPLHYIVVLIAYCSNFVSHTKLSSSQLDEKSKSLQPDSSMTTSQAALTVDTRSGTLPTSIVTSQSMDSKITKDGQPRPLHDGHTTHKPGLDLLLDDGNSSDSSSHDPERKKKSGLFKIFKHKEK